MAGVIVTEQTLFVWRHGERLDTVQRDWRAKAARPYDTPLSSRGFSEALRLAKQRLPGKAICAVASSPMLRCMQTAQMVSKALDLPGVRLSKGLCELVRPECHMKGQPEVPDMAAAEDSAVCVLSLDDTDFPEFPEPIDKALERYERTVNAIADQYWPGNVVVVSHEYCVVKAMRMGGCTDEAEATYCGQAVLARTQKETHQWALKEYQGVYKYDTVM